MPKTKQKPLPLADALAQNLPLTSEQCAEFLQISTMGVRRLVSQGLPHYLVGSSRRFDVNAVRTWLGVTLPKLREQSNGLHARETRLH